LSTFEGSESGNCGRGERGEMVMGGIIVIGLPVGLERTSSATSCPSRRRVARHPHVDRPRNLAKTVTVE
jgi:hypothetical protein